MKKSLLLSKLSAVLVATLCGSHASHAALIAQWNFDTGTAADLTSDVGGFTFALAGAQITPTYNPGSITVWGGSELVATGINSTAQPALATTATVWVSMENDFVPAGAGPEFFFGLENATAPADWDQSGMTGMRADFGGGSQIGQYSNTSTGAYGTLFVPTPALGTPFTMALVLTSGFDDGGFPDPTRTQFQTYVDGVLVGSGSALGTTVPSLSFALGTLKASGGGNYTFDEVRVYDSSLTAAEIAAIPEPASLALLLGGVSVLAIRMGRRVRKLA